MTSFTGQTISHYKVLEKLGGGGMGIVYKAHDTRLDRPVALKFLPPYLTSDPEAKERFVREAKAASALDHNNLAAVHDICETDDGQTFIVMAFYEGETLKKKIERGPLKVATAIDIAIQAAQGLQRAHEDGITHRDIKPANIIVTARDEVKIVDFGLAKLTGQQLITQPGQTIGTVAYVSPEQARGTVVDHRTDIWSLGVVLYEMLAGRRPFEEVYENSLYYSIINAEPEPLTALRSGIPLKLEAVVQKCLAKNPHERYQHADELIVDLRACTKESTRGRGPSKLPSQLAVRRKVVLRYALLLVGFTVIGLAAALLFLFRHDKGSAPHPRMIAVLPFVNLGPAEDEYFADGLTDEITSRLGSISSLGVISQTSSMQYKKTQKTLPVVARELGVDYILEGSITWEKSKPGGKLRISLRLIKVSGDVQLWAEILERTLADIFKLQKEIATHVVTSLGLVLAEGEKDALEAIPTGKLDAYQAYLRGEVLARRIDQGHLKLAIEMYERATNLDSAFAKAYAELSKAHLVYYLEGYDRTDSCLDLAKRALDQAFALQPDLPQAHLALGYHHYLKFQNYEAALKEFSQAQQKLPNDSRVHYAIARVRRLQGNFEEAIQEFKKALILDPQDAQIAAEMGYTLSALGLYKDAETYFDRSISLLPDQSFAYIEKSHMYLRWKGDTQTSRRFLQQIPTDYFPWSALANLNAYDRDFKAALNSITRVSERAIVGQEWVTPPSRLRGNIYLYMHDTVRARASFDSARVFVEAELAKSPYDSRLHSALGIIYAALGHKEEATQEAERAVNLQPLSKYALDGWFPLVESAHVNILLGNHDAAIDILEYLLSLPAPKWTTRPMIRLDPIYDPLRGNSRFDSLVGTADVDERR